MLLSKEEDFDELRKELAGEKLIALDTETTKREGGAGKDALNWNLGTVAGVSVAHKPDDGYFWLGAGTPIKDIIEDGSIAKVFHNSKFDMHFLSKAGTEVKGKVYDTFVLARLLDETRKDQGKNYKLKPLAVDYLGVSAESLEKLDQWLEQQGLEKSEIAKAPLEILAQYAADDAKFTLQLYYLFRAKLKEEGIPDSLIDLESDMLRIAYEMEKEGIHVGVPFLEDYKARLETELNPLRAKLMEIAGEPFNPESDEEVRKIAFKLDWKPVLGLRVTKAGISMDKDTLKSWDHPFFQTMAEYRRFSTVYQTFVVSTLEKTYPSETGPRVHCEYSTAGADTGRWSSRSPNLQNQDKKSEARKAFIPKPGHEFWFFDYKQIEPVIFAFFAESDRLCEALMSGLDFHSFNAQMAFKVEHATKEQRTVAKGLGLALMYNAGKAKAAKMMGVGLAEGTRIMNQFHKNMPEVKKLQRALETELITRAKAAAQKSGRLKANEIGLWQYDGKTITAKWVNKENTSTTLNLTPGTRPDYPTQWWGPFEDWSALQEYGWIQNPFGRKLRLQMKDAYKAVNRLVQSTAADALKTGMLRAVEATGTYPLLQVHDELVFQWPTGEGEALAKKAKQAMESIQELFPRVPIRVDVAKSTTNWAEEEEVVLE